MRIKSSRNPRLVAERLAESTATAPGLLSTVAVFGVVSSTLAGDRLGRSRSAGGGGVLLSRRSGFRRLSRRLSTAAAAAVPDSRGGHRVVLVSVPDGEVP